MDILTNLSLFSGAGGLDLGAHDTGHIRTVCYVEFDRYAQAVLQSRMRDGQLDDAPIWDDIKTFDGRPWGGVDIISGGFPCQDVSNAGKRAGMGAGTRSGLWGQFHRIIREAQPRFVLVENVLGLLSIDDGRGFGTVLGDLAEAGYDAEWFVLSAADVGAPHRRERVWIVAHAKEFAQRPGLCPDEPGGERRGRSGDGGGAGAAQEVAYSESRGLSMRGHPALPGNSGHTLRGRAGGSGRGDREGKIRHAQEPGLEGPEPARDSRPDGCAGEHGQGRRPTDWWATEPAVGRVAHGVASRVDRLRLCGNGVVRFQSAPAWWKIIEKAQAVKGD